MGFKFVLLNLFTRCVPVSYMIRYRTIGVDCILITIIAFTVIVIYLYMYFCNEHVFIKKNFVDIDVNEK